MSLETLKFAASDFTDQDVASLPDDPSAAGYTAAQLKERFDNVAKQMLALGRFNALLELLAAAAQGASGAGEIGAYRVVWTGDPNETGATTVQESLAALKACIDELALEAGAVVSVNGKAGAVVLAPSDLGAAAASVELTIDLPTENWTETDGVYTQTVAAAGVTASSHLVVTPAPASFGAYGAAAVRCTGKTAGSLAFTASSLPAEALAVNVLLVG